MKFKDIPQSAFSASGSVLASCGFTPLVGYKRLYTHSRFPDLVFRRVSHRDHARAFGGVALVRSVSGATATTPGVLDIMADNIHSRWDSYEFEDTASLTINFVPGAFYAADSSIQYRVPLVSSFTARGKGNVKWTNAVCALAVVTPCCGIGRYIYPIGRTQMTLDPAAPASVAVATKLLGATGGSSGFPAEFSNAAVSDFMLQWRTIPFTNNAREYLRTQKENVLAGYSSNLRKDARRAFMGLVPSVHAGPAVINLCYLRTDSGERVGLLPQNILDMTTIELQCHSGTTSSFYIPGIPTTPFEESRWVRGQVVDVGFHRERADDGSYNLSPVFNPELNLAIPFDSVKKTLRIANIECDAERLLRDFVPLRELEFSEGVTRFDSDLIPNPKTLPEYKVEGMSLGPVPSFSYIDRPDIIVDTMNLCAAIDADLGNEPLKAQSPGGIFRIVDGFDMVSSPASDVLTVFDGVVNGIGAVEVKPGLAGVSKLAQGTVCVNVQFPLLGSSGKGLRKFDRLRVGPSGKVTCAVRIVDRGEGPEMQVQVVSDLNMIVLAAPVANHTLIDARIGNATAGTTSWLGRTYGSTADLGSLVLLSNKPVF